jgi:hypothetical protein
MLGHLPKSLTGAGRILFRRRLPGQGSEGHLPADRKLAAVEGPVVSGEPCRARSNDLAER